MKRTVLLNNRTLPNLFLWNTILAMLKHKETFCFTPTNVLKHKEIFCITHTNEPSLDCRALLRAHHHRIFELNKTSATVMRVLTKRFPLISCILSMSSNRFILSISLLWLKSASTSKNDRCRVCWSFVGAN